MNPMRKVILTVVITGLVVGGGTYWYANSKATTDKAALQSNIDSLNNKVSSLEKPTAATTTTPSTTAATPSTTTVVDPTADWKTYTDNNKMFSVKYPPTFTVLSPNSATVNFRAAPLSGEGDYPDLSVAVDYTSLSLTDYIAGLKKDSQIRGEQSITLDGKAAYEAIDTGMISVYGIYTVNAGRSFNLVLKTGYRDTLAANKADLTTNQKLMLASFKFTN